MGLLLSGGGNPEQVIPLDTLFASRIDSVAPVLYIPVAMEPFLYTYAQCLDWFCSTYRPLGIQNIDMCADLHAAPDLSRYTAIFIGGGNTFKLLKEIKESRFDAKLTDYLRQGGFVYGSSAGAIIFGKTIRSAQLGDENNVGLTDLSGLNRACDHDIWCHYAQTDDAHIRDYDGQLYILHEESGLLIEDGAVQSVGKAFFRKEDVLNR